MTNREISYIQFLSLYKSGKNDTEIGKALGFSRQRIGVFRRKLEFPKNTRNKHVFTEEMDDRIREMHEDKHTIQEIANEFEFPYQTVRNHCLQLGIDTGKWHYVNRGGGQAYIHYAETVLGYLKEHGPTWRTTLIKDLRIPGGFFPRFLRTFFDEAECFTFKRGRGKRIRLVHDIYGELTNRPFLALRSDPRIVDFVTERIPMKIECGRDAAILAQHLGKHLGKARTREVIERLYTYVVRPPRKSEKLGPHGNKKFTDEEYLMVYKEGLNDTKAADVLGVTAASVCRRRGKLGLPTQGQRRRLESLGVNE